MQEGVLGNSQKQGTARVGVPSSFFSASCRFSVEGWFHSHVVEWQWTVACVQGSVWAAPHILRAWGMVRRYRYGDLLLFAGWGALCPGVGWVRCSCTVLSVISVWPCATSWTEGTLHYSEGAESSKTSFSTSVLNLQTLWLRNSQENSWNYTLEKINKWLKIE